MKQGKGTKRKHQRASSRGSSASPSRLEQMISEAIVDCYNDSEQAMGLFNMIEEKLRLPFSTIVLGIQVTVEKINLNEAGEIVAVCAKGPERQRIPIVDLPLSFCATGRCGVDRSVSPVGEREIGIMKGRS